MTFKLLRRFPMPQVPMEGNNGLTLARNGMPVHASSYHTLAKLANGLSSKRMRVALQQDWGPTGSATASADTVIYSGLFRTSHNMEKLRFRAVALPAETSSATEVPKIWVEGGPFDNNWGNNITPTFYVNKRRASGTILPDEYFFIDSVADPTANGSNVWTITSNRQYWINIHAAGYARLMNFTLFEEQLDWANYKTGITGIKPYSFTLKPAAPFGNPETELVCPDVYWDNSFLGMTITISGSPASNDGTFTITRVVDTSTIRINNPLGGVGPPSTAEQLASGTTEISVSDKVIVPTSARPGTNITTKQVQEFNDHVRDIWKRSGGRLFDWSGTDAPINMPSTFREVHSQVAADHDRMPGHWVYPEKMGSYESTNVPCVAWVEVDDGTTNAIDVEFRKSDGTVLCSFSSVNNPGTDERSGFHTATLNLDSTVSAMKVHVHAKYSSTTAALRGYGMYQWEDDDQDVTPLTIFGSSAVEWWFKSDSGITGAYDAGGGVTKFTGWNDQSGRNRHLTSDGGDDPQIVSSVSTINNYDAVYFTGAGDEQLSFPGSLAVPATCWTFGVVKNLSSNSVNGHQTWLRIDASISSDRPNLWLNYSGYGTQPFIYDATGADRLNYGFNRTKWMFLEMGFRQTTTLRSITATYWDQFASTGPASTVTNTSGSFSLGNWETLAYDDGGAAWADSSNFYVAEVFCVNVEPTSTQLDEIRDYVIARYGWT